MACAKRKDSDTIAQSGQNHLLSHIPFVKHIDIKK